MITRGEEWGTSTKRTDADIIINGDIELAQCSTDSRLIVVGGDIAHSLGDPTPPLMGADCTEVPIDALRVIITFRDGTTSSTIASSHVMIGQWLRGRLICISNGGFIGRKNVSPRAHLNDGFFDVMSIQSSMGMQQRIRARHRSVLGTHVPHPLAETRRAKVSEFSAASHAENLTIDGKRIRSWTTVQVEIVPDYWRLLV